jgi:hypothetical protein
MNKHILVLALSIVAIVTHAQTEKTLESKITDVTVFLNRAQVTREAKTRNWPWKFCFAWHKPPAKFFERVESAKIDKGFKRFVGFLSKGNWFYQCSKGNFKQGRTDDVE